jgi:hypothetical protein
LSDAIFMVKQPIKTPKKYIKITAEEQNKCKSFGKEGRRRTKQNVIVALFFINYYLLSSIIIYYLRICAPVDSSRNLAAFATVHNSPNMKLRTSLNLPFETASKRK